MRGLGCSVCLLAVLAAFVAGAVEAAEPADGRLAVPSLAAQQKIGAQLEEVYKVSEKKAAADKVALARELLKLAANSPSDPTEAFVLLRRASELAADGGNAALVLEALDKLTGRFLLEPFGVQEKMLARCAEHLPGTTPAIAAFVDCVAGAVGQAVAQGRLDKALELALLADKQTERPAGRNLHKETHARYQQLEKLHARWQLVEQAKQQLKSQPDDAAANETLGRWALFVADDRAAGLACLARGTEPTLRKLAAQQIREAPQNAVAQVQLGDAWWDAAEGLERECQNGCWRLAADWYRKAQAELPGGLIRAKVEKRLAELADRDLTAPLASAGRAGGRPASGPVSGPLPGELKIVRAVIGAPGGQADVTQLVQAALDRDPFAPLQFDDRTMGDPAPGQQKKLALAYRLGRQTGTVELSQAQAAALPQLPSEGLRIREASQRFTVLAARYGAGLTWIDITPAVRQRAADPTQPFECGQEQAGRDPWFGVNKSVAVWFDYQGKRYVRVLPEGKCVLLP